MTGKRSRSERENGATIEDLPPDLMANVLKHLDHEDLCNAFQVNRTWRAAGRDPILRQFVMSRDLGGTADNFPQHIPYCLFVASKNCYDCGKRHPTGMRSFVNLIWLDNMCKKGTFRLCSDCKESYSDRKDSQKLLTKTNAKFIYKLSENDLKGVPYALGPNPVFPSMQGMNLYRRPDLAAAAIKRWGSVEKMWSKLALSERLRKGLECGDRPASPPL